MGMKLSQPSMTCLSVMLLLLLLARVHTSDAWISAPSWRITPSRARLSQKKSLFEKNHPNQANDDVSLEEILHRHGYDKRLVTLRSQDFPLLVEVFRNGEAQLAKAVGLDGHNKLLLANDDDGDSTPPQSIQIGDVTTIYPDTKSSDKNAIPQSSTKDTKSLFVSMEPILEKLYNSHVGRARKQSLTKKQLGQFSPQHQAILRQVLKAGAGQGRIVDSITLAQQQSKGQPPTLQQIAGSARLLGMDAGGRFKRWPCLPISSCTDKNSITILNGGWLAVDLSVRAGNEARNFVRRDRPETISDERIARRLECLAMGEVLFGDDRDEHSIELDVREVLQAMELPVSPEGAKTALVQIGRWTGKEDLSRLEPWPQEVLRAASWFVENRSLPKDGRVDLTKLPCVSIDAERTAFRDDAFGIRPRADTGRRVIPDASKWEILIHIVDVSDIYTASASSNESLRFLKEAAMKRGMSRYDLPLGPLHLLPPRVLDLLSFSKDRKQQEAVTLWAYIDERDGKLLDAGLERTCVSTPWTFSFSEATSLLDGAVDEVTTREAAKARALLLVVERNLKMWSQRRLQANKEVRKREARLEARQRQAPLNSGVRSFERTRAHRLVDASLDLYGSTLWYLLRQAKAPVPVAAGADISRGGRVATAPLRRYIDGEAQRQALAVLCGYGEVLSAKECKEIGRTSNEARNSISNFRALRNE